MNPGSSLTGKVSTDAKVAAEDCVSSSVPRKHSQPSSPKPSRYRLSPPLDRRKTSSPDQLRGCATPSDSERHRDTERHRPVPVKVGSVNVASVKTRHKNSRARVPFPPCYCASDNLSFGRMCSMTSPPFANHRPLELRCSVVVPGLCLCQDYSW